MNVTGFALSLVLTLGQGPATLEVGGWVALEAYIPGVCGVTVLPFLILTGPQPLCDEIYGEGNVLRHEVVHVRQMEALGPGQPVAYILTGGRPFEDYVDGFEGTDWTTSRYMWDPGPTNNCPHLRINGRVEFMPCWRF